MKNRSADVPYCGCREEVIKNAKPVLDEYVLGHLKTFLKDRYEVRLNKDVKGLPAPWTQNEILQKVKFTNVRREHDRQSKAYINHIASKDISWFDKFWNTVMFRMFNISTMWDILGEHVKVSELVKPEAQAKFREMLMEAQESGLPLFTNAFNTGGLKQCLAFPEYDYDTVTAQRTGEFIVNLDNGSTATYHDNRERFLSGELVSKDFEPFMAMRVIRYIAKVSSSLLPDLHDEVFNAADQRQAFLSLTKIRGFSRFLAYQVFVDLTYCEEFPFSENEFTVSGPGCDRGLQLLFRDTDGMRMEECLFWLRDNHESVFGEKFYHNLFSDLPDEDRCPNVMSLENTFCETLKYMRCVEAVKEGKQPRGKVSTDKLFSPPTSQPQPIIKQKSKKLW